MNRINSILFAISILIAATACSDNEPQAPATDEPTKHYATMTLDGGIVDYDAARATTAEWAKGDSLFIKFYEGTKEIKAIASYRPETNNWLIECYDFPTEGYTGKCDIVYIAKSVSHDENYVTLDNKSFPYSALKASYSYVGGSYSVEATLKHDQGRMRFKGEAGTKVVVKGFWYYNQFSIKDRTYSDVEFNDTVTIGNDGYSPYCYGFYPDGLEERIWISHPDGSKFWRKLLTGTMQPGTSGSLTIPTDDEYFGWTKIDYQPLEFEVNGVKFKMMPVEGGTFYMGGSHPEAASNEKPAHKVMLSDFYIGETEVTQALYAAVIGARSDWTDTYGLGDKFPAYNVTPNEWNAFITKLNYLTGKQFRTLLEIEWEYAAKEGNKAVGYTYSGGSSIDNLCWYKSNSSSTSHPVAGKAPNALGLYDMSGNLWEYCWGYYYYSDKSNWRWMQRGGSWNSEYYECNVWRRDTAYDNYRYNNCGFRIGMSIAL